MPPKATFGAWIKERRAALDLTRESLAERVGCAAETIRKIERGQRRPSVQLAELLAVHLKIPADQRDTFVRQARGGAGAGPEPLTPLIGREANLEEAGRLIRQPQVRLVTLCGAPGVGKTRLALALAKTVGHVFADGAAFVEVPPAAAPGGLLGSVASGLGLRDAPLQTPAEALARHFKFKQQLLVLDNFEGAVAEAPLLTSLLADAPGLKILVTSRMALNVAGEHRLAVPALSAGDAARLFRGRAEAGQPGLTFSEADVPALEAICRALDCLPLAIELAAARLRLFSLADLADHLGLNLSAAGRRDLPIRQTSLREAIGWSYRLLGGREQALFRRLSVLAGGGDFETICALSGEPPDETSDALLALLDASLVQAAGDEAGGRRFRMLSLVRAYALEQLVDLAEETAARDRHLEHFAALAEAAGRGLLTGGRGSWLRRLAVDHDNLSAALDWARRTAPDRYVQLAGALGGYWHSAGRWQEGRAWLRQMDAVQNRATAAAARALQAEGVLAWAQCDLPGAAGPLAQAAGIYQQLEMADEWAYSLVWLGVVTAAAGDFEGGDGGIDRAVGLFEETGHTRGLAFALTYASALQMRAGRMAAALAAARRAESLWRTLADDWGLAGVLLMSGSLALAEGDLGSAERKLLEGLPLAGRAGDAETLHSLEAGLAYAALCRNDVGRAGNLLEPALKFFTGQGTDRAAMSLLYVLAGAVARADARPADARKLFADCLALNADLRDSGPVFWSLIHLAGLALAAGRAEEAARLWSAAEALQPEPLRNILGLPLTDYERRLFEGDRDALAAAGGQREWSRDQLLSLLQTVIATVETRE